MIVTTEPKQDRTTTIVLSETQAKWLMLCLYKLDYDKFTECVNNAQHPTVTNIKINRRDAERFMDELTSAINHSL